MIHCFVALTPLTSLPSMFSLLILWDPFAGSQPEALSGGDSRVTAEKRMSASPGINPGTMARLEGIF